MSKKIKDKVITYEDIEDNIVKNRKKLINLLEQSLNDLGMKVGNIKSENPGFWEKGWEAELYIYIRLVDVCIPEYTEENVDKLYESILNSPFGKFCESNDYVEWEDFWIKDGSKRKVLAFSVIIHPNPEDFKEDLPNFAEDSKKIKDDFNLKQYGLLVTKDEMNALNKSVDEILEKYPLSGYDIIRGNYLFKGSSLSLTSFANNELNMNITPKDFIEYSDKQFSRIRSLDSKKVKDESWELPKDLYLNPFKENDPREQERIKKFIKEENEGESLSGMDFIPSDEPNPYEYTIKSQLKKEINDLLKTLTSKEEYVIKSRFGIGCNEKTLKEIAEELNLSLDRVRQIEKKALYRLMSKRNQLEHYLQEDSVPESIANQGNDLNYPSNEFIKLKIDLLKYFNENKISKITILSEDLYELNIDDISDMVDTYYAILEDSYDYLVAHNDYAKNNISFEEDWENLFIDLIEDLVLDGIITIASFVEYPKNFQDLPDNIRKKYNDKYIDTYLIPMDAWQKYQNKYLGTLKENVVRRKLVKKGEQ